MDETSASRTARAFKQMSEALQSHADAISMRMTRLAREVNQSVERNRRS